MILWQVLSRWEAMVNGVRGLKLQNECYGQTQCHHVLIVILILLLSETIFFQASLWSNPKRMYCRFNLLLSGSAFVWSQIIPRPLAHPRWLYRGSHLSLEIQGKRCGEEGEVNSIPVWRYHGFVHTLKEVFDIGSSRSYSSWSYLS